MKYPRIMIAGVQSGVGKTTISLGLMAALKRQGFQVQAFKVGPDYIDPGLHLHATGRPSHNLDSWMGSPQVVRTVFARNAARADISVVEGVMGLYDGVRGEKIKGSSADIALILRAPVLLVVNTRGMAQSCIALVKGFKDYYTELQIRGVILNQASAFHRDWVKKNLEDETGLPVLGCLERDANFSMPERYLGLLPADENQDLDRVIDKMAEVIENHVDVRAVVNLATEAPGLDMEEEQSSEETCVTIAVARDAAFSFYYQDSLDYLQELGAKLVFFSPLSDASLPRADGLYIGGGFPEKFLNVLTHNHPIMAAIREVYASGQPIFAECGGYMYLTREILEGNGKCWAGVGIIPARTQMTGKLQALGYVEATALQDSILARRGDILRGHEFHYSISEETDLEHSAFSLQGGRLSQNRNDGYTQGNLLASYLHLHLRSNPRAARSFLRACLDYQKNWDI